MNEMEIFSKRIVGVLRWQIIASVFFLVSSVSFSAHANKTPNEVTQLAQNAYREVMLIREGAQISSRHREPGVQQAKVPMHVYGKSREVLEKLSKIQQSLRMSAVQVPPLPLRTITPVDVFELVSLIHQEVLKIKSAKGISQSIQNVELKQGLTPSDAYEQVWRVSLALDALTTGISPNEVFQRVDKIHRDLKMIADKKGVRLSQRPPELNLEKRPLHVNLAGFKNLHLLVRLQKNLAISRVKVAHFPKGEISPADVYDTVNNLEVEIARVKLGLGIDNQGRLGEKVTGKAPGHVYQTMMHIQEDLKLLVAANR